MNKLLIFSLLTVVLFACQKEISFEDPNGATPGGGTSTGTTGTKLVRVGTKSGADSSTVEYTYNSSNRIISVKYNGTNAGTAFDGSSDYVRNTSNIITQEVLKSSSLAQYGLTSITTNHIYDASKTRYSYSITKLSIAGQTFADSTVYAYDASGKLTSKSTYGDLGAGYSLSSKEDYTYSGSNVASVKYYSYDPSTGAESLDETDTYEYDAKVNPVSFPADAVILGLIPYYNANNIIKSTMTDSTGSGVITTTYTYNASNKPTNATSGTDVATYYYQ